jgi:hypothetical protein
LLPRYIITLSLEAIYLQWCELPGLLVFATARKMEAMSDLDITGIIRLQLDVTNIESIREAREQVKEVLGATTGSIC